MLSTTSTVILQGRKTRKWPVGLSMIAAAAVSLGLWFLGAYLISRIF